MTKPSEWIIDSDSHASPHPEWTKAHSNPRHVHVIEKSGYDALEARLAERDAEFARLKTKCNDYQAQLEDNEWKVEKALQLRIKELEAEVETQTGISNRLMKQVEQLDAEATQAQAQAKCADTLYKSTFQDLTKEREINKVLTEGLKQYANEKHSGHMTHYYAVQLLARAEEIRGGK